MATDRDEQQRQPDEQHRQQQELEEIRRSFAEMGARMGSMFEPTESDEPVPAGQPALPAPPPAAPAPAPSVVAVRPRWWWATLVLLFVAGAAVGWILPRGDGGSDPTPPSVATPTTSPAQPPGSRPAAAPETRISVPQACLDTAEKADEVISRLNRNDRSNRLAAELRDYTIASQACRKEASP
jgi:hypothetical protein